jgi:hypothetical protein
MTGRRNRTPTRTTTLRHRQRHLSLFMSSSSSSTTHCLLLSKISCLLCVCVCVCSFLKFVSLSLRWMCCCHSLQKFLLWDKQKTRSYNQAPNLHSHLCKELVPKELKDVKQHTYKFTISRSRSLSLSTESFFLSPTHTHTLSLSPSGVKCSSRSLFAVLLEFVDWEESKFVLTCHYHKYQKMADYQC